jgi:hypothetical protein
MAATKANIQKSCGKKSSTNILTRDKMLKSLGICNQRAFKKKLKTSCVKIAASLCMELDTQIIVQGVCGVATWMLTPEIA